MPASFTVRQSLGAGVWTPPMRTPAIRLYGVMKT